MKKIFEVKVLGYVRGEKSLLNTMLLPTPPAVNVAIYATLATAKTPTVTPNAALYLYGKFAGDQRSIDAANYLTYSAAPSWGAGAFGASVLLRVLGFTIWATKFAIAGGIGMMVLAGIAEAP
jgi:hypothetical protein